MIRFKFIFWIVVLILIIALIPTAESRKHGKKRSKATIKANARIEITAPPSDKITETSNGWKSVLCEFLGAQEDDLDLQLVKEIFIEVGRWYVEIFIDSPSEYIAAALRIVTEKCGEFKSIVREHINLEWINLDIESVKDAIRDVCVEVLTKLTNIYNLIPEFDFMTIYSELPSITLRDIHEAYKVSTLNFDISSFNIGLIEDRWQHTLAQYWEVTKVNCQTLNDQYNTGMTRAAAILVVFYTLFTMTLTFLLRRTYRPHTLCSSDITRALANEEAARKTCVYDFEVLKVLGGNSFCRLAIVSRTDKATKKSEKFAVKIMSTNGIPRGSSWVSLLLNPLNWIFPNRLMNIGIRKELSALKSLICKPFAAGLACAKKARDNVYFFLDVPHGNSLQSLLIKDGPFKPARLLLISAELVAAIQDMHSHGMVCGKISPDTVILGGDRHVTLMNPGFLSLNIERKWNLRGTTPVGMASSKPLDFGQDWYQLGLCLLWLVTGKEPEIDENGKLSTSQLGALDEISDDNLLSLIKVLLGMKSNKSENTSSLRDHAYFAGIEWNRLVAKNIEMAYDLEENDKPASDFASMKDTKESDIKDIVRYLEGIGTYKIKSL